ncbi:MAG: hypothetical protein MZW92_11345 [Comamonadaceae bacterium]|nr:hypothetical protein [Comamonadaceae bacterium]
METRSGETVIIPNSQLHEEQVPGRRQPHPGRMAIAAPDPVQRRLRRAADACHRNRREQARGQRRDPQRRRHPAPSCVLMDFGPATGATSCATG